MKKIMTKADGKALKRRWAIVNKAEISELRRTPMEQKVDQLVALMSSVGKMGWDRDLASETGEVRDRWNRLRKVYLG